jgi:hypothetical protein
MKFNLRYVFAVLCLTFAAWAQTPTGAIEGAVTDPSGAVVPNAKVVVTEVATGRTIPLTTNAEGRYAARNLLPGNYNVRIEAAGFTAKILRELIVNSGAVVNGNASLEVGTAGEVVEVTAQAVMVDTSRQVVDTVISSKDISEAPLFTRNFLDLATLAPGVSSRDGGAIDPTKSVAYRTVGVAGRSGTATRVQVDGIDITDETVGTTTANFSQDSVREFQLTRSSLDPSTSLTSSGAINIITKSGSNEIHGGGFWDYYNQDMGARLEYQPEAAPFKRKRVGVNAGGPLIKDKLFWYVNWERNYQTEQSITNEPFWKLNVAQDFPVGIRYTDARLDWNASSSIRAFARFHQDWNLATGGTATSPYQNVNWTPTVTVGFDVNQARFTHSYRFGYVKMHNRIESQELQYKFPMTPNGIPYNLSVGSFQGGPNSLAPQATYQTNYQNSYEASYVRGIHVFRFGFDVRRIMTGGFANFAGPLQITGTYDSAAVAAIQARGGNIADPTEYPFSALTVGPENGFFFLRPAFGLPHGGHYDTRLGSFVQDSMKLTRNFTMNIGVRWQWDSEYFSNRAVPRDPMIERWIKGGSTFPEVPKTLFSPSVGFAWDPRGNGKTVLRGGFYRGYEMNIGNNTMFDEFSMLPNGLGPDIYDQTYVAAPDGTPINVDGKHPNGDYSDLLDKPIKSIIGTLGAIKAAVNSAYASYKFDPKKGITAFQSAKGLTYGGIFPGKQYKMPYALQFNLGVQHELTPGTVLSVDYIYNHGVGLPMFLRDYELRRDASTLNVAAAQAKIQSVLGGLSMDQWIAANPTKMINTFGFLANESYFTGLYPDMTRARFFTGGFTKYRALQFSLRGGRTELGFLKDAGWNVSYALGRSEASGAVGRVEFGAGVLDNHNWNSRQTFGPNNLDYTHMLTVSSAFTVPGGFRFDTIWTFRTAAPTSVRIPTLTSATSGANAFFAYDFSGDWVQDLLPGVNAGQLGRKIHSFKELNKVIQQYNSTMAGQITAYGKALVSAGLFTEAQLKKLGAVAPTIPLAPETNPWPFHNILKADLRFSRPVSLSRFREGMRIIPSVDFYNLFNHAPVAAYPNASGTLLANTFGSLNYDYVKNNEVGDLFAACGRLGETRKVMIGLRFEF